MKPNRRKMPPAHPNQHSQAGQSPFAEPTYRIAFEHNAFILLHSRDTAPKPFERALSTAGLMRESLSARRKDILAHLHRVPNLVDLGPMLEEVIGIPMIITLFDLESLLAEDGSNDGGEDSLPEISPEAITRCPDES